MRHDPKTLSDVAEGLRALNGQLQQLQRLVRDLQVAEARKVADLRGGEVVLAL